MSEPGFRRLLAFDCSGAACSAALWIDGQIAAQRFAAMARGQAEALMPQIESVMREAGLDFCAVEAIATTIGPGSFTGLRLGLAAARGLALAAARPLVPVTSFEAMLAGLSEAERAGRPVAIAIDSRRGPVFAQMFDRERSPAGPPVSLDPAEFDAWLPPGPAVILADAAVEFPPAQPGRSLCRAAIRAADVARLAAGFGIPGIGRLNPAPLYLRAPDVTMPQRKVAI
jgi:tRNA threonylcarbamoyladenosine biosynthesis protein TsaB